MYWSAVAISFIAVEVSALAGEHPLIGSWKLNPARTTASPPTTIVYGPLEGGLRVIPTTGAPYDIHFEKEQQRSGSGFPSEYFRFDERTYVHKIRVGANIMVSRFVVSTTGKEMLVHIDGPAPNSWRENVLKRVGGSKSTDPFIGAWVTDYTRAKQSTPPTETFAEDNHGLRFSTTISGVTYLASTDGREYAVAGSKSFDSVTIRQIGDRTFVRVYKKDGRAVIERTIAVARDGNSLTHTFMLDEQTLVYVYERQPTDGLPILPK